MYRKVYIEITNVCNMHCSFCHGHHRAPRQMTEKEFLRVLAQLRGQTEYIYYHLLGEPLTHPLLPRFLALAREQGYRSVITTNGTLLGRRGEEILSAGVHKVNVSLHSFEEGNEESHAQYLCEVADFALRAAERGTIVVLRLWNRGHDDGKNGAALQFLREHLSGVWQENARGVKILDKLFLEWGERFAWPDMDEAEREDGRFFCYGLADQFGILADGTVVPCCLDSEGTLCLGNIFTEDVTDILYSERACAIAEGFRRGTAAEPLCRRCGFAARFI